MGELSGRAEWESWGAGELGVGKLGVGEPKSGRTQEWENSEVGELRSGRAEEWETTCHVTNSQKKKIVITIT